MDDPSVYKIPREMLAKIPWSDGEVVTLKTESGNKIFRVQGVDVEDLPPYSRFFWGERLHLLNEFASESDRGVVLCSAAYLEELLHQILLKSFVPPPKKDDELFGRMKPLSSFSAKIEMCYRMGLIDKRFCQALNLVRRIRNEFAHSVFDCELTAQSNRITDIFELLTKNVDADFVLQIVEMDKRESETTERFQFRTAVEMIAAFLHYLLDDVRCVAEINKPPLTFG